MAKGNSMDGVFNFILRRLIETGVAPFYTEIAAELGVTMEEGRQALNELVSSGVPAWLFPQTDYISSFAPFSNLPTQYRISVEGDQKWFAQWGFEALAVSWLFPKQTVIIQAPCLDCGQEVRVEMKDGEIKARDPQTVVGYTPLPFKKWFGQLPYAWSTLNLFRSEEHVKNWRGYEEGSDQGMVPLDDLARLFSSRFFTRRLDPD